MRELTNGRDVALSVGVVGEAQQQARFADTGVADEEQLEQIVVLSCRHVVSLCLSATSDEEVEREPSEFQAVLSALQKDTKSSNSGCYRITQSEQQGGRVIVSDP